MLCVMVIYDYGIVLYVIAIGSDAEMREHIESELHMCCCSLILWECNVNGE